MLRAITALSTLFAVLLFAAAPAHAHGGKITLEVAGDGATGVTVRALYQSDRHPVEDKVLRLTLTATGDGGRSAGPFDLGPAAEGRGFYSSGGVLTPGRWTVVVTAADPNVVRGESTVDARAPQAAPAASPSAAPGTAVPDPAESGDSGGGTVWTVLFVVALALAGLAVYMVRRRASAGGATSHGQPPGRRGGRPVRGSADRPRRHP